VKVGVNKKGVGGVKQRGVKRGLNNIVKSNLQSGVKSGVSGVSVVCFGRVIWYFMF
jgi:hypothetical protein